MRRARHGFAVVFALFVIILFGAIATAMAFAAGSETRASRSTLGSSQALAAVESPVWTTVSTFDWFAALAFLPGNSSRIQIASGQSMVTVWVVRLDSTCFLVQGSGGSGTNPGGNPLFLRRVGVTIEVIRDSTNQIRVSRVPGRAWTELFQP
jgi:hypothetical protein